MAGFALTLSSNVSVTDDMYGSLTFSDIEYEPAADTGGMPLKVQVKLLNLSQFLIEPDIVLMFVVIVSA